MPELLASCGPVLGVWEGHAVDPEIRFLGASGGLLTALELYCLELEGMHGVLHTGADPEVPWKNKTRLSRSRSELLSATGSRYSPASVCDGLAQVGAAPAPCVVVGQPSEIVALRKAQGLRPDLNRNIGLAMSFFCAGSPATQGTLDLLAKAGIDPRNVSDLRYRGKGWPGNFSVRLKGRETWSYEMSYAKAWGFLQAYRPFSVHLFPDGTGEDADISCGDPWYHAAREGEAGSSLILVRTERGRRILSAAARTGYVVIAPVPARSVLESQKNLFDKRGAIWGRVATMRLFWLPTPGMKIRALFRQWLRLPWSQKLRSTLGTGRRICFRNYFNRMNFRT